MVPGVFLAISYQLSAVSVSVSVSGQCRQSVVSVSSQWSVSAVSVIGQSLTNDLLTLLSS